MLPRWGAITFEGYRRARVVVHSFGWHSESGSEVYPMACNGVAELLLGRRGYIGQWLICNYTVPILLQQEQRANNNALASRSDLCVAPSIYMSQSWLQ